MEPAGLSAGFRRVRVIWNDDLDLSCDELYANGETVKTPLMD